MELTIINTFTDQPFKGNPAAVCLLTGESDSEWMQRIAKEINMPVTTFIQPHNGEWKLRWFTPSIEIPICGHGTLASSFFYGIKDTCQGISRLPIRRKAGFSLQNSLMGWFSWNFRH